MAKAMPFRKKKLSRERAEAGLFKRVENPERELSSGMVDNLKDAQRLKPECFF